MDQTNRLTNIPYNYYIQQDIENNTNTISNNSNSINSNLTLITNNSNAIISNTQLINSNLGLINQNTANINILEGNQNLLQLQVNNLGTSFTTNNLIVNGNATVSTELFIGSNLMNVEPTILNIDSDLGSLENKVNDIENELTGGGSGLNFGNILQQGQDFFGFLTDVAIGATVASYFGANGLKDQALLNDLAENALDNDWTGEDQDETETNEENNKALWTIYQIYKRPFCVINRDIYGSNPTRYTSKISGIDQYAMGYLGNQYCSPNTLIGCSSNIEYRVGADNAMFEATAIQEHHIDTLIYRDSLQGVKSELFVDYLYAGISNMDPIGTITPSNDYTYAFRCEGDMNLNGSLNFNSTPIINFDSNNDQVYMNSLLLSNTTQGITYQTASNGTDNQNILVVKNSTNENTLRLRRDLFNTTDTQPNFIFSVGNEADITQLQDCLTINNNGLIELDQLKVNGNTEIFGHTYSSGGVDTNKGAYQITIDADGVNSNLVFSFEIFGNISYQNIRMQSNNITEIGSNNYDLDLTLTDLNERLQTQQNLLDSSAIETSNQSFGIWLDNENPPVDNVFTFGTGSNDCFRDMDMNSNNIINIGTSLYNLDTELTNINSKISIIDSNNQIDYSNVINGPDTYNSNVYYDSLIEFQPAVNSYIDFKQVEGDYNQRIIANSGGLSFWNGGTQNMNLNGSQTTIYTNTQIQRQLVINNSNSITNPASFSLLVDQPNNTYDGFSVRTNPGYNPIMSWDIKGVGGYNIHIDNTNDTLKINNSWINGSTLMSFNDNVITSEIDFLCKQQLQITNNFELYNQDTSNVYLYLDSNTVMNFERSIHFNDTIFGNSNVYTNNLYTFKGGTPLSSFLNFKDNQIYHWNTDFSSNLFCSFETSGGSTKMVLDDTCKIGTAPGSNNNMFLESDNFVFQECDGTNILEIKINDPQIRFNKDIEINGGLSNMTEIYNNIYAPLNVSSSNLRITDINFNSYIKCDFGSSNVQFDKPVVFNSGLQLPNIIGTNSQTFLTFDTTNNQVLFEKDLKFVNEGIVCGFSLFVYNSDKSKNIKIDPNTDEINNVQSIACANSTETFQIRNSAETSTLFQVDSVLGSFQPYAYIESASAALFTGGTEKNVLTGIASGELTQSEFNGTAYNIINYDLANDKFQITRPGIYRIDMTIIWENDNNGDISIWNFWRKNSAQIGPQHICFVRNQTVAYDKGNTIHFSLINKVEVSEISHYFELKSYTPTESYQRRAFQMIITKL